MTGGRRAMGTAGQAPRRVLAVAFCTCLAALSADAISAAKAPPPRAPTRLHVTAANQTSLRLAWKASPDRALVTGYYVYRGSRRVAAVTRKTTSYTFRGLRCGTGYVLGVAAHDAKRKMSRRPTSRRPTAACPVPVDTQAPSAPSGLTVTPTPDGYAVSWNAATDNIGVTGYRVYFGGALRETTTATSTTLPAQGCGASYTVAVEAFDAAANSSSRASVQFTTAACPDTQAPSKPTALRVTASTTSSLTVSWSPATDNVGVSGYDVYLGDARVATGPTTSVQVAGLTCGTSYGIGVAAVDAAGNASSRVTLTDATDLCPSPPPSGGTLRVDLTTDVDFTDPTLADFSTSWQLLYATGLRLYNYPDRPAPDGSMLVHEAAAGFPLISDDGRTYTITVEPGFEFSDGTPVTANDFAYAINRALSPRMASPASAFIRDILGAQDVVDGRAATASGVQVQGDRLVITLVKPAGDFLARLAMPWFQAIKTDMPINPDGVSVYPSAGPYYVAARGVGNSITLRRNPYYTGNRPANADTIRYNVGVSLAAQELRVINGETDLGGFPTADAANLANTYGVNAPDGQFHVSPTNVEWFVNLNVSRPPFDNVNLRKAVNYAVDRPLLAAQTGAYASSPTDQILPTNLPGFRNADIYPLGGPDLDKARALAGNSCGTVKLWSFNTAFGPAWANVLKANLEAIGCTVQVTLMDRLTEVAMASVKGADFDLMVDGWSPDYLDPYVFLDTLLNGSRIQNENNVNRSYFNDPDINAQLAAATALTGDARYKAYGDLDVEITTDHAPWITLVYNNARVFNSSHVRGFVYQPAYGADLNAFFVK